MAISLSVVFATLFTLFSPLAAGQLVGHIGPTTSYTTKAKHKTCDITDYGAVDDGKTDAGPAIQSAWDDCYLGGLVYIPPGEFAVATFPEISNGVSSAVQLDGTILRTGTDTDSNVFNVGNCTDFEFFSGNSKGWIQGYGYEYISQGTYGPRIMRVSDTTDFSIHGFAVVDSPSYYFVFDTVANGEIYNMIIQGISIGETDAFDIWGTNVWFHDIQVTNGDECVCVKSPSSHIVIEDIYCNISGRSRLLSFSFFGPL